ncbi:MAG: hypothetical protein ACRELG_12355 [Gemmataceae bacterium]
MAAPLRAGESAAGREMRHRLSTTINYPGLDDPRATLNDALDQMSKRYNLTFDIKEKVFEDDGVKELVGRVPITDSVPIPPMHTTLAKVLQKILRKVPANSGATYLLRNDVIEITTMDAIRKEFFAERPATPGPLPPLVCGAFDKVPLEAALKELNQYGNIVLDARAAKEGQMPVTADLANVPLDTMVRMFADMAGLAVVPLDNALYVTSKDNARDLLEEREKLRLQRQRENKEKANVGKNKEKKPSPAVSGK